MSKLLSSLFSGVVLALVGWYLWTHTPRLPIATATEQETAATTPSAAADDSKNESQKMMTVTGPLADYLSRHKLLGSETSADAETEPKSETARYVPHRTSALDHVGDSPVGTSAAVLKKTFRVTSEVDSPFEIPAHAANPQLSGTYQSFAQQAGVASSDDAADVEFLVMNQQQFLDFHEGRPSDALFSADSAHNGEVHVSLPPTLDRPAKYYLVFRNSSQGERKKAVQADFRVNF